MLISFGTYKLDVTVIGVLKKGEKGRSESSVKIRLKTEIII